MNDITLGSNLFCVPALPAMRAFALQPRVAPAVATLVATLGEMGGTLAEMDVAALGPAMSKFCAALPAAELEAVTRELLADATVDGVQLLPVFDAKMRGRTMDTWRLLWHALKVNYPDFFGLLAARRAGGEAASPSEK